MDSWIRRVGRCWRNCKLIRIAVGAVPVVLSLAIGCASCSAGKQQSTRMLVIAESDPGKPLRGVSLVRDAAALGRTNVRGELRLSLSGPIGEAVPLRVECPPGHKAETPMLQVVLRSVEGEHTPQYRVRCHPDRRLLVLAVRAKGAAGVPLRYLDQEIGRTDGDGVAHGFVALAPGALAKFVLDTRADEHRYLRPQNPVLQVTMPDRDEVVSIEQSFVNEAPKKKVRQAELPRRF